MNVLSLDISQNSCKHIYIRDASEYDLSIGSIKETYLNILVPGKTSVKKIKIPTGDVVQLNSKNLGIQTNLSNPLQTISDGYFKIEFVVEQTDPLDFSTKTTVENFCYYNTCNTECVIQQLQLDYVSNTCCKGIDCRDDSCDSTKYIDILNIYNEGLKAAGNLCKEVVAKSIADCLAYKIETLKGDCKCCSGNTLSSLNNLY